MVSRTLVKDKPIIHQYDIIVNCLGISIDNNMRGINRSRKRFFRMIIRRTKLAAVLKESSLASFTDRPPHFLCRIATPVTVFFIKNGGGNGSVRARAIAPWLRKAWVGY